MGKHRKQKTPFHSYTVLIQLVSNEIHFIHFSLVYCSVI